MAHKFAGLAEQPSRSDEYGFNPYDIEMLEELRGRTHKFALYCAELALGQMPKHPDLH